VARKSFTVQHQRQTENREKKGINENKGGKCARVTARHTPLFLFTMRSMSSFLHCKLFKFTRAFAYLVPVGLDEAIRVHAGHAVIGGGVAGSAPLTA
jgi:hypothetical protein